MMVARHLDLQYEKPVQEQEEGWVLNNQEMKDLMTMSSQAPVGQIGQAITSITTVTHLLFVSYHPSHNCHLIFVELLEITAVSVDGMVVTTKPIVNGAQRLLNDLIPLPEVLNQPVVLL